MADFFSHENHSYPPSLSIYGKIRQTTKSDTITILEKRKENSHSHPYCTTIVFDGAAIFQMVAPNSSKTFHQYCNTVFKNYIYKKISKPEITRADIVFDVYKEKSVKSCTREKRETGKRIKVVESTPLPKNWKTFLHVNENKTELFGLISQSMTKENSPQSILSALITVK